MNEILSPFIYIIFFLNYLIKIFLYKNMKKEAVFAEFLALIIEFSVRNFKLLKKLNQKKC
jgi:hypothetical protein